MRFNPFSHAFGLDIGDRSLKLVQISKRGRGKPTYSIDSWSQIELPEGIIRNGEIVDVDQAVENLSKLIASASVRVKGRACVACLPEVKSFIKIIEVDKNSSESEIKSKVTTELEQNVPMPLDEIYHDWKMIDSPQSPKPLQSALPQKQTEEEPAAKKDDKEDGKPDDERDDNSKDEESELESEREKEQEPPESDVVRVLFGAAPKQIIDNYTLMLERAGTAPIALEIEAAAISRAVVPDDTSNDHATGILDIGATRSALIIHDNGAIQMSIGIPISGHAITKMVSEALKVELEDAEKLKRECGLDVNRCEDKMWKILYPLIDDITEKIRNALRFYKIGFPDGKKIEKLLLCGGGAQFREIDTVLSRKLAIKVERGNPLINVEAKLPKKFPAAMDLNYATAIGLALRAADELERYRSL